MVMGPVYMSTFPYFLGVLQICIQVLGEYYRVMGLYKVRSLILDVTIGFEHVVYVVVESAGSVRLNVSVLAGVLSRMVNVTLTISGGSGT